MIFIALLIFVANTRVEAVELVDRAERIPFSKVFTDIPATSGQFLDESFSHDALPGWGVVLGSTALLYYYDEDILRETQHAGRVWGLGNADNTKTVLKLGKYDLLRLPSDTQSALYFMGDGWLDMGIMAGFLANGYITGHVRPYNTSMQLLHGMILSGIFDQVLKHSFGRESPSDHSEPRGQWRPFTPLSIYNQHTSRYDAMPSGHVMTSTLVFTIIRGNYPEYDGILFATEVAWLSVLGFAMINNGVHWASDYPLGIAIGYMIGKASMKLGQPRDKAHKTAANWTIFPSASSEGVGTINWLSFF